MGEVFRGFAANGQSTLGRMHAWIAPQNALGSMSESKTIGEGGSLGKNKQQMGNNIFWVIVLNIDLFLLQISC